jgi:hypothetical protein
VQRLKDARTEADKEIEAYRKVKEQEFSAFQSSVSPILIPYTQTRNAHTSSMLGQRKTHSLSSIKRLKTNWPALQMHMIHTKAMY